MHYRKRLSLVALPIAILAGSSLVSAEPAAAPKPTIAKICTNCHKAEPGVLRGHFEDVSMKAKAIQIKIDESAEVLKFDEDTFKVVNEQRKTGDIDLIAEKRLKKGHEVNVEYKVENGVKIATKLIAKPPVELPASMLISTAEVEKLVAKGSGYHLFDSRPLPRFQEGSIPTAVNLPFPAFDKLAPKLLPADKNAPIVFYCAGPTCNMSPGSATKAKVLGYTNLKVYKDGMPAWLEKNYGVLSGQFLKEAWLDKDIPHVLLDVRPAKEAANGFIKGAVAFPAKQAGKLVKGLKIKKNAPVMVYDQGAGADAKTVAGKLVKAGFKKVVIVDGGFAAWQKAGFEVAQGKLAVTASYVPKPRPGEIALDEFKKYAAELPANVMIIDVRNADEGKKGMLKTAKLIPAEEIKDRASEIPKDKMVITHCSTGVRAEMAYHTLKDMGYTNIRFVNGKVDFDKKGVYSITKE